MAGGAGSRSATGYAANASTKTSLPQFGNDLFGTVTLATANKSSVGTSSLGAELPIVSVTTPPNLPRHQTASLRHKPHRNLASTRNPRSLADTMQLDVPKRRRIAALQSEVAPGLGQALH